MYVFSVYATKGEFLFAAILKGVEFFIMVMRPGRGWEGDQNGALLTKYKLKLVYNHDLTNIKILLPHL